MTGEEICTIVNRHVEECDEPPKVDFDDFEYVSYFENAHGDQSIFLYDSEDNIVVVYMGDAGWDNPQTIPGRWLVENTFPSDDADIGILPDSSEETWLKACKSAVQPRISQKLKK